MTPDNRPSVQGYTEQPQLTRRRFLGLMATVTAAQLLSACSLKAAEQPTVWNDPSLQGYPDRGLTSLMIRFDSQHDPAGSVRMETCYENKGKFRVVIKEASPRPGPLVDQTFEHGIGCYPNVWPISPIDKGDVEFVYLGLGNTDQELSTNVRAYGIRRTGDQTLEIQPQSPQSIELPGTLIMRDHK